METMGSLGEFGFIDRISRHISGGDHVLVGPGDDCAVIQSGGKVLLVTCDASLENIHFDCAQASAEEIGWKAAAGAISDIAAMGGLPQHLVVTLGAPASTPVSDLDEMYNGIRGVASPFNTVVIGGDTIRSPHGLLLDITVLGEAPDGKYLLRKGAHSGDMLVVTGTPGRSAAGRLARGEGMDSPALEEAHYHPLPRVAEGQWLNQREEVHALVDVSDGVVQDAGHIACASNLGVAFTSASVAIDPVLVDFCIQRGESIQDYVFYGGEDYELAFAVAADRCETLLRDFREAFDIPVHILGEFSDTFTGTLVDGEPPQSTGWDHFKGEASTN
jgi:thiamine-monophosphate kinase